MGISGVCVTVNIILGPGGGRICTRYDFSMSLLYSATSKAPHHYCSLFQPFLTKRTKTGVAWWKHLRVKDLAQGAMVLMPQWGFEPETCNHNKSLPWLKYLRLAFPPAVPVHSVQVDNILLITTQEITRVSTMTNVSSLLFRVRS